MTIVTQAAGADPTAIAFLEKIAEDCNKKINDEEDKAIKNKKKKRTCQKMGQDKHKCCDDKLKEHEKSGADPKCEGERAYQRPKFDKNGQVVPPVNTTPVPTDRAQTISNAIQSCGPNPSRAAVGAAIGKALAGLVFPDAAILGPNGEKTFVDFKFACPESHRSKKKSARKNYRPPSQSPSQEAAHTALGQATGGGPTATITGF
jgi:hypothetical protein